ncbi:MAG: response regulator [Oligoflexia bacterium]|nr:response regulator [Oligoflexia bacterium]
MRDSVGFTQAEQECIYKLAEGLTGTCQSGNMRRDVILTNVRRRMHALGLESLSEYLERAAEDGVEHSELLSALTIHTTSWFREMPHFRTIEAELSKEGAALSRKCVRLLSAACSSGQEVYSFAILFESLRTKFPGFEYELVGFDLDPLSVSSAEAAIYPLTELSQIPKEWQRFVLKGQGPSEGLFTLTRDIRSRCSFETGSLKDLTKWQGKQFDFVVCRNVLIYFTEPEVERIVRDLSGLLSEHGRLMLGHSEGIDSRKLGLQLLGGSIYARISAGPSQHDNVAGRRKVLVIDDSPTIRQTLVKLVDGNEYAAVGVSSADEASEFLKENQVDIITLDLHMPGMSGQTWLRMQRAKGMRVPVVVVSGASPQEAMEVLGALENGAQDYIEKGVLQKDREEVMARIRALVEKQAGAVSENLSGVGAVKNCLTINRPDVICLGASTGGTEALALLLKSMPPRCPPVLVVQHISPSFCKPFAERLAHTSGLLLGSSIDGAVLQPGSIYLAHSDYHIGVKQRGKDLVLITADSPPVNRHRPSVDFLFQSAANLSKCKVFAAILTGMGADGARGLLELSKRGAMTLAQNEDSCVVFGMPREAIRMGAAQFVGDTGEIRRQMDAAIRK